MWEPQPLTTLRASKACRGENLNLLDVCITITVDYNSSHIELLLDNEFITVFLLVLGVISSL
jgi:hypothetical protein